MSREREREERRRETSQMSEGRKNMRERQEKGGKEEGKHIEIVQRVKDQLIGHLLSTKQPLM